MQSWAFEPSFLAVSGVHWQPLRLRLAFGHEARGPMRRKNGNGRMYFEHRNMDGYDRDAGPLRKQSLAQSAWLGLIFTNQKIIRL